MEGSCCCLCETISVYFAIYFRPQRSTDDEDVCYAAEEQEVRSPKVRKTAPNIDAVGKRREGPQPKGRERMIV